MRITSNIYNLHSSNGVKDVVANAEGTEEQAYGSTDESTIRHMVDIIVGRFAPVSIILFGSRARGDADEHSDVDLLVVMQEGTDEKEAAIPIQTALYHSPLPKDVVVNTPKSLEKYGRMLGTVQYSVLREGVKLYG